jgi:hypothetical protein
MDSNRFFEILQKWQKLNKKNPPQVKTDNFLKYLVGRQNKQKYFKKLLSS